MENNELKFSKIRFFIILILLLIGIGLCVELGWIFIKTNFHETFTPSFCAVSDFINCDAVALTPYSVSMGVPNAVWGLLLYLVMLMLLFVDRIQAKFKGTIFDVFENPSSYIATLGVISFVISIILACISIFEIKSICSLCFCTYFINLFISFTAKGKGFFIEDIKTTIKDFIKGAKKYFVLFIVVLITFCTSLYYLDKTMIASPKLKRDREMKEFMGPVNKHAIKGNVLGKEKAKVVIEIYSDYNCPFCRVMNNMLHKLAKEETILVKEVNFPLDTSCNTSIGRTLMGHESSCIYSKYALAAKKQGKFWGASTVLFDKHPKNLTILFEELRKARLNLDEQQLAIDANSPEIAQELQEDIQQTLEKGINATPTISINGVIYVGGMSYDDLKEKVKAAKSRAQNE